MFAPMSPKTERTRIRTEREYREWQMALRGTMPVKRLPNQPGFLSRLANPIRRLMGQQIQPVAEPRRIEQQPC